MNTQTVITAKQDLICSQCASHSSPNVEHWIVSMIAKRQALCDATPDVMPDIEFTSHLILSMPQTGKWNYTANMLYQAMISKELDGRPLTSSVVISMMREQMKANDLAAQEEVVMSATYGSVKRGHDQVNYSSSYTHATAKKIPTITFQPGNCP
jgi:hypothetical protein